MQKSAVVADKSIKQTNQPLFDIIFNTVCFRITGMFGVLTMHLIRLVNYGNSYEGAEDIYDLLVRFPLQHTIFHLFNPKRKLLIFPKPKANNQLGRFYLLEFDGDAQEASAKYHSGYSTKIMFDANDIEGLRMRPKKKGRNPQENPAIAEQNGE